MLSSLLLLLLACSALICAQTPKKPVADDYHGVNVADDYRWLENFADPEVWKWSDEQNRQARAFLDGIPSRAQIYERLKALYADTSAQYSDLRYSGGTLFAMKEQPPKEQAFLVTLRSAAEPESARVLADPGQLDATGGTAIDFYVPSLDGKLVAVSLSKGGSEEGTVHVFDVATGKALADEVPRVNGATAGGSVAWNKEGSGFYYTRYPRSGERPDKDLDCYQQIYFHRLGAPTSADTYALGKEFPRIAEVILETSPDGLYVLATVSNGDGGERLHYLLTPAGRWRQTTLLSDETSEAHFGPDGTLYLLSRKGSPNGKILRLSAPDFALARAKVAVAAGKGSISGFTPADSRIYVRYMVGGPSEIRVYGHDGKVRPTVPTEPVSSVGAMLRLAGDELLFENETFLEPPAWYRYDSAGGKVSKTALARTSPADFSDAEVVRQFAISKDGARIPLNIVRRKGPKLDGTKPVLLTGYGGYGISLSPQFSARNRLWLDRGGVFVVANLRGGAEYGDSWHQQGRLTKKQNVFDDFQAVAQYLVKAKYTTPEKLAIEGGSNGGLLMGAALTQRPDLYRAVVSHVGIYDMLRVELSPNGAFNVTEFGTVKEPDQFRALYDYSPYHHVNDGTDYPAVLFMTGDHDGRVDPANSRKMTARLQAATHSGRPILLRTSSNSGHGIGTALSERIAQDADVFAFLFEELGIGKQ